MLKQISIVNYALIKRANISFENGFTTITGESGAGKSIMLEAIGLILGGRANFAAIRTGEEKCVCEATFEADKALNDRVKAFGLDVYDDVCIRRELTLNGRSRAFVNDTPVNVSVLKSLGATLVDLHGQAENIQLQTTFFKINQLDGFAHTEALVIEYQAAFSAMQKTKRRLNELKDTAAQIRKDKDYFQFQYDELSSIDFRGIDMESLEDELKTLENAQQIIETLNAANHALTMDQGAIELQQDVKRLLGGLSGYSKDLERLSDRFNSLVLELNDLTSEIEQSAESISLDPTRFDLVNEILDETNRLLHKHGVKDLEELEQVAKEYEIKLSGIDSFDEELEELEQNLKKQRQKVLDLANTLSLDRVNSMDAFSIQVQELLHQLGMPKARFQVSITRLNEPNEFGLDQIEFLIDANDMDNLLPIDEVASGGESARIMLALKAVASRIDSSTTMIFDEIDTGVSGEVAKRIGRLMQNLSKKSQIIAVTHSPGVAAKGHLHIKISKEDHAGMTESKFIALSEDRRVDELAGMFSGDTITEANRVSARGLLSDDS